MGEMKLVHRMKLAGRRGPTFTSVTHYSLGDDLAHQTALAIRQNVPDARVRVVNDYGIGFTHVFVDEAHAADAEDHVIW